MRIALFGLTGFGTCAFEALRDAGFVPDVVLTRAESGPHPHYECANLLELAKSHGVDARAVSDAAGDEAVENALECLRPDLLLCVTYHRRISHRATQTARYAINLHPGSLPEYRGATPSNWALVNGERETAVTAHALWDAMDAGPVYASFPLAIPPMATNGELRRLLARYAGEAAVALAKHVAAATLPVPVPQDESRARTYPNIAAAPIPASLSSDEYDRWERALTPWPGPHRLSGAVRRP